MCCILAKVNLLRLLLDDRVEERVFLALLFPHDSFDLQCTVRWLVLKMRLCAAMTAEAIIDKITHSQMPRIDSPPWAALLHVSSRSSSRVFIIPAAQVHTLVHFHPAITERCLGSLQLLHTVALESMSLEIVSVVVFFGVIRIWTH